MRGLTSLRIDGFRLARKRVERGAISATKVDVLIDQGFRTPLTLHQVPNFRKSGLPPVVRNGVRRYSMSWLMPKEGAWVEPSHAFP